MAKRKNSLSRFLKSIDFWDIALVLLFVAGILVISYLRTIEEAIFSISIAVVEAIIIGILANRVIKKALK